MPGSAASTASASEVIRPAPCQSVRLCYKAAPARLGHKRKERAMSVEAKVKSIIAEQLGAASLDIVELVMAMEEEFEVEIPDEEAEHIKTVQDAVNFINEHKK